MKSYLITDPFYYQNFKKTLINSIEKFHPDFICFRDKNSIKNAKLSIDIAKFYKIPIIINQHYELLNLGFDGIHLTSMQLNLIDEFKQYIVFASTHNEMEVKNAQKSDFITFSPIFYSKNREGLGLKVLNQIVNISSPKVFGLGGIVTQNEVSLIQKSKAYGFASIRYFVEEK